MNKIKFFTSVLLLAVSLGTTTVAGIGAKDITNEQKTIKEEIVTESLVKEVKEDKNTTLVIEKNTRKKTKSKKKPTKKLIGTFKITGYCSCSGCCGKSNGITASGTKAKAGRTIAADTSRYPFGTKLVINGHTYTVEDRGGAINGNKIDLFFDSHSEALQWGVRYCEVYIKK